MAPSVIDRTVRQSSSPKPTEKATKKRAPETRPRFKMETGDLPNGGTFFREQDEPDSFRCDRFRARFLVDMYERSDEQGGPAWVGHFLRLRFQDALEDPQKRLDALRIASERLKNEFLRPLQNHRKIFPDVCLFVEKLIPRIAEQYRTPLTYLKMQYKTILDLPKVKAQPDPAMAAWDLLKSRYAEQIAFVNGTPEWEEFEKRVKKESTGEANPEKVLACRIPGADLNLTIWGKKSDEGHDSPAEANLFAAGAKSGPEHKARANRPLGPVKRIEQILGYKFDPAALIPAEPPGIKGSAMEPAEPDEASGLSVEPAAPFMAGAPPVEPDETAVPAELPGDIEKAGVPSEMPARMEGPSATEPAKNKSPVGVSNPFALKKPDNRLESEVKNLKSWLLELPWDPSEEEVVVATMCDIFIDFYKKRGSTQNSGAQCESKFDDACKSLEKAYGEKTKRR
jgi:hypothetical protein